ncbi:MAG: porin [Gammaproteobacteria bacterium]|nr:MAG: porin [Gammaproteobacteria bacterium]
MKQAMTVLTLASMATVLSQPVFAAGASEDLAHLYGQLRVSIDNHSGDWAAGQDGTSIVSNASRLGVKGHYPAGILNANLIYQAEVRYETTDSVNGTASKQLEFREGYAGLASKQWGRARLGRLSVAYKTTLTKIDPWNDNAPQSRASGRQGSSELHSSYFNNAVDYVTPKIAGGLTASVWMASEFNNSTKPLHNTGTLSNFTGGRAAGAGIRWNKGPLFLSADYIDINADAIGSPNLANDSGWQVGARYKIGAFSVAGLYEDVKKIGLGKNAYVNGIYKVGKTRIIATYGTNKDAAQYGNKDWRTATIGAKYSLPHKSELFAAFVNKKNTTDSLTYNTFTVGLNAKFGY